MNCKGIVVSLMCSFAIVGCGPKDENYKEVAKDIHQVNSVDIKSLNDSKLIYSHTITKLPSYLNNSVAYDLRRHASVRINLVEDGIEVRELPKDIYTTANSDDINNWPMVLFIPGHYVDYKCQEDSYDKCINQEVVDSDADIQWDQKHYFIPDFANVEQFSIDQEGSGEQFNNCMQQQGGANLVHDGQWLGSEVDLTKGVINFELEKRYTLNNSDSCQVIYRNIAGSEMGAGNGANSFSTHEFYSLVAKSSLDTNEYTPVPYTHDDFARFGFFDSETDNLGYISLRSRSKLQDGHRYHNYLYRWNPNRKTITYYLDNRYYLPQNKPYLDSAKRTVKAINIELQQAKTGVPSITLEKQGDKRFGDLRYSFISLDNFADNFNYSGLTESITDTQTGEIVSSRIIMNLPMARSTGTEERYKIIQDTFKYLNGQVNASDLSKELSSGEVKLDSTSTLTSTSTDTSSYDTVSDEPALTETQRSNLAQSTKFYNSLHGLETFNSVQGHSTSTTIIDSGVDVATSSDTPPVPQKTPVPQQGSKARLPLDIQSFWTTNLAPIYGPDSSFWDNPELWTGEPRHSDMLPYSELSDKNKLLVQEITGNGFYSAILTHELGHSLGLRHNFRSSIDISHHFSKNSPFYKTVQPKIDSALGVSGDKSMQIITQYSSVMEYMAGDSYYNKIYGAYDLAALRFGYAREIQTDTSDPYTGNSLFDADAHWMSLESHDNNIISQWQKELPTAPSLGNGAISSMEQSYNMDSVRYEFCSDADIETDFYCNKSDIALQSSATNLGGADTLSSISRQLLGGLYIAFFNQALAGNGLYDMSALGKVFDNGDYYTASSSLIKVRHNIARSANAAGIYDADDYLNDQSCPYNFNSVPSPYSPAGLEQCTSLRFALDSSIFYSVSAMNMNDVDARVKIYLRPKPNLTIDTSEPILVTDINLSDVYKAAIQSHIAFNKGQSAFNNPNDLYKIFQDEQHQSMLIKILIMNNQTVVNALALKSIDASNEDNFRAEITPSATASVVTPLNGINLPNDIHPQDGNLYKRIAPQWPTKLELVRELLRSSDLDPMDHFSNLSMVDYDHKMGRVVEMFLCNSVMHTDYSDYHLSTIQSPLSYPTEMPTQDQFKNTCKQDIIQYSDITNEGPVAAGQPYAPYISSSNKGYYYENYIEKFIAYNIQGDRGNDAANKYIEPVTKSSSNKHLYQHFDLPFSNATEEGMTMRINYLKALLKQVVIATEDGVQGSYGHSTEWREYVSVHKDEGLNQGSPIYTYDAASNQYTIQPNWVAADEVYDPETGKSVYIGPENILAAKLRDRIQNSVFKLYSINQQQLTPPLPQIKPPLPTSTNGPVAQSKPPLPTNNQNSGSQTNAPLPVGGNSLSPLQQAENYQLQIERDKRVLFELLPQLS
ncbi:hypothetical protein A9264_06325 [Vibrio sp. UCD-FRSSP16_10]|uniref:hypothetical protein n=1 Tax=unclassified Vibrio TaxID=2614977 RepID=UPI0007FCB835|nr:MULTISPECIES: hypothetical protein [unclassified Vibrio]OBT15900.1 hypothetical protein A9264_06325 [Vibrio sp. UCD-FRSSP16_10]OBT17794.1 hypothetical protein A9260_00320 [Vibrio sp. UCD-FRSSP16_30]